jgi:hypothetical protein
MPTTGEATRQSLDAHSEADLIARVRMGNRDAFLELARHSQRPLYRLLFAMCGDEKRAAAHTTETLVVAAERLPGFPPGRRFHPWLVGIARSIPSSPAIDWTQVTDVEEHLDRALSNEPGDAVFDRIERNVEEQTQPGTRVVTPRPVVKEAGTARVRSPFPWGVVTLVVLAGSGAFAAGVALVPRWLGASPGSQERAVPVVAAVSVTPEASAAPAESTAVASGEVEPGPAVSAAPTIESATEPPSPPPAPRSKPARGPAPVVVDFGAPQAVNATGQVGMAIGAHSTATEYDSAADGWEQSLGMLRGAEYRDARFRVAEARYRAWQIEPDGPRAAGAAAALQAYLVAAPQGPERVKAAQWLEEIEAGRAR